MTGLLAIGLVMGATDPALGEQSLHVVPSPVVNGSELSGTAAIAHNDIWAVDNIVTGAVTVQPVAEHFDGTQRSIVPTPPSTATAYPA